MINPIRKVSSLVADGAIFTYFIGEMVFEISKDLWGERKNWREDAIPVRGGRKHPHTPYESRPWWQKRLGRL